MQTTLVIVRHGETIWNVEQRLMNHLDSPLTALGLDQAERVARRIALEPPAVIYSSDLERAMVTARMIGSACRLPVHPCPRLQEYHNGVFAGLTWEEIRARFPVEYARYRSEDIDFAPPSGESRRQFHDRIVERLEEIVKLHPGELVLVVGHGGTMSVAFRHALKMPPGQASPARLPNASLNVFEIENGIWKLRTWGDTSHLLGEK